MQRFIPPSPLNNLKPATDAGFTFRNSTVANVVPKFNLYKRVRLVEGKRRYIEYYYRVPAELEHKYPGKDFIRFRLFEDLNKDKSKEYADFLMAKLIEGLDNMTYSPFIVEKAAIKELEVKKSAKWSLSFGMEHFIDYCKEKELRRKTLNTYTTVTEALKKYFIQRLYDPIETFTQEDIEEYLRYTKRVQKISNNTRNNYLSFIVTIFNHFIKRKVIKENPAVHIDKLPVTITKHKYYDDKTLLKIKALLRAKNTQLYQFCEFIYYTGTRPESEARKLQVKHVLFDRELILIPGSIGKNKKDDYIPMSKGLIDLLKEMGVGEANPEDYLFSKSKKPGKVLASPKQFQKPFLDIRREAGISDDYTMYSFKHTRAIHLAQDGTDPYEIMKLFRHSGLDMTMKYLRDLGISDNQTINLKTRKF